MLRAFEKNLFHLSHFRYGSKHRVLYPEEVQMGRKNELKDPWFPVVLTTSFLEPPPLDPVLNPFGTLCQTRPSWGAVGAGGLVSWGTKRLYSSLRKIVSNSRSLTTVISCSIPPHETRQRDNEPRQCQFVFACFRAARMCISATHLLPSCPPCTTNRESTTACT